MTIKLAQLTERSLLGIKMTENHNYLHENILDDLLKIKEMVRPNSHTNISSSMMAPFLRCSVILISHSKNPTDGKNSHSVIVR